MVVPAVFGVLFGIGCGVGNVISDMQLIHKPAVLKKRPPTA
jgi:hypothetical protein